MRLAASRKHHSAIRLLQGLRSNQTTIASVRCLAFPTLELPWASFQSGLPWIIRRRSFRCPFWSRKSWRRSRAEWEWTAVTGALHMHPNRAVRSFSTVVHKQGTHTSGSHVTSTDNNYRACASIIGVVKGHQYEPLQRQHLRMDAWKAHCPRDNVNRISFKRGQRSVSRCACAISWSIER